MKKRIVIGAGLLAIAAVAAGVTGWSSGHLAAQRAATSAPAVTNGQVQGVSVTPSPSATPLLHGSDEQAAVNAVDATPSDTPTPAATPVATPRVSESPLPTPAPTPSATPLPTATPKPITSPLPVPPPTCGRCGGPVGVYSAGSLVCPNIVCPL